MAQAIVSESEEAGFFELCRILEEESDVKGLEFFKLDYFKESGRGLCSLLSRQPGEELFSIPLKYCLTDYNIENNEILKPIWKKYPSMIESSSTKQASIYPFMLLFFYELNHPSSTFKKYWFQLFPRNLNNFTIAWSDAELKACGILCPIRRLTVEIQVWIKKSYQTLNPIINKEFKNIFDKNENSKEEYIEFTEQLCEFICMMCRSRGCRLNIDNKNQNKLSHCFVPIGDFGNHRIGAKSMIAYKYNQQRSHIDKKQNDFVSLQGPSLMSKKFFEYDNDTNSVIVRSQEAILANDEICYEYTQAPNWELLSNFGFCVSYNPYDRVIVSMTFENDNKRLLKELRMIDQLGVSQFLKKMDDKGNKYSLAIALTLQDPMPTILLAANRIKLLTDEQLDKFTPKDIAMLDKLIEIEYKQFKKQLKNKNVANSDENEARTMNDNENENENGKNDNTQEENGYNLNELCSLEFIVLKELRSNMNELLQHYNSEEPPINKADLKHEKDVKTVYKSIRQILQKSEITVAAKISHLSQVMEFTSSSESEGAASD